MYDVRAVGYGQSFPHIVVGDQRTDSSRAQLSDNLLQVQDS